MERISINATDVAATPVETWRCFGTQCPKPQLEFFAQTLILYVVVVSAIVKLALGGGDNQAVWISLLSSCIGYLLPHPTFHTAL